MNKIVLVIGLMIMNVCVNAQDLIKATTKKNYLSTAPLGFINKFRISYEREITNRHSGGFVLSYHYGHSSTYHGPSLYLFYKFYVTNKIKKQGRNGWYFIVQPGLAYTQTPYNGEYLLPTSESLGSPVYLEDQFSIGYGCGLGLGYKLSFGRFFIDTNLRFQYWGMTNTDIIYIDYGPASSSDPSLRYYKKFKPITNEDVASPLVGTFLFGFIF